MSASSPDGFPIPLPAPDDLPSSPMVPEPGPPAWLSFRRFGLTRRESEVLWWISQGKRDREIALIFGRSPRTIHRHVSGILAKLDVETRTAALALLHRQEKEPPSPSTPSG